MTLWMFQRFDRNQRFRMAAGLCGFLLLAAPLIWAWQLRQLADAAIADPRSNPPATGLDSRRAASRAHASGYAPPHEQPLVFLVNNPNSPSSLIIAQTEDPVLLYRQNGLQRFKRSVLTNYHF